MSGRLQGKVAIVTGGNSGIGKATAIMFAQAGARVVVAARRVAEGEQTVEEIRQAGGEALFVKTDVAQAADVEALVHQTVATYGRLDCAFNNAAGTGGAGPLHTLAEEEWERILAVNLKGVWLCMKYQIAQMLTQGGGAIVNNSSLAGLIGVSRNPTYAASKHGLVGLSKSAALQYATQGIRINVVCPGLIMTPRMEQIFATGPGVQEWFLSKQPRAREGALRRWHRRSSGHAPMLPPLSQGLRSLLMVVRCPVFGNRRNQGRLRMPLLPIRSCFA